MSGKSVDVLAVMGRLIDLADWSGADEGPRGNRPAWELARDARKARDAMKVALEALRRASAELESQLNDPNADNDRGFRAADQARAALAKCGATA